MSLHASELQHQPNRAATDTMSSFASRHAPLIVDKALRSPGQPLETTTRAFMESRFGHDFSGVRIHTDSNAIESAQAVKALAYTVGNNIVFGTHRYVPNTFAGRYLLAHELTHVVQQAGASDLSELALNKPDDQFEDNAQRTADHVCAENKAALPGRSAIQPTGQMSIQRQTEDDPGNKYPPDWQHGAPTKPVEPDPHVTPMPGTKPEPQQGPYRTPQKPAETDEGNAPGMREKIANALKKAGIPPWAAAALITLIVAALLDPEPFTKIALLVGAAAAVAIFIAIGRQSEVPPGA